VSPALAAIPSEKLTEMPIVEEAIRQARVRDANLRVFSHGTAQPASSTGGAPSRGRVALDAAPSDTYAGLLIAAFRPNIVLSERLAGNPVAEVEVTADPDGRVIGRRLSKSSGRREWDETVLRAVDRTRQLPKDIDGRVPHKVVIVFRPND
jgi:colicin import membrane protein